MPPSTEQTINTTQQRTQWASEMADFLDEKSGDYPVVFLDSQNNRVVAAYSRTELHVYVEPGQPALQRRTTDVSDFQAPTLADALQFVAEVEALRQKTDYPYLRFPVRPGDAH